MSRTHIQARPSCSGERAQITSLSASSADTFLHSITLVMEDLWYLDLNASPRHEFWWGARTHDPAQGFAITWDSGEFYYFGNSPVSEGNKARPPQTRFWRSTVKESRAAIEDCELEVRLESWGRGLREAFRVLAIEGAGYHGNICLLTGGSPVATDESGIRVGRVDFQLASDSECQVLEDPVILPRDRPFHLFLTLDKGDSKSASIKVDKSGELLAFSTAPFTSTAPV